MNYKAVLEKYWAGETTIAEEKALKAYFSSNQISEELLPYAALFQYYESAKKETLVPTIDTLLVSKKQGFKQHSLFATKYILRSIAAAVLVLIIASIGYQNIETPNKAESIAAYWESKEIKDPKIAFLKTKAALLLVSKKLNNGRTAALQQVTKVQQVGQFIKSPE